jgi:hypothetical protein
MKQFRLFPLVLLVLALSGFAQKKNHISVTFHVEANEQDSNVFSVPVILKNPPRKIFVEKMASLTEREIQSVFPFQANDGTMGCSFKLDDHGTIWLDTLSIEHLGKTLVGFVNERQVIGLLIDRRVADGIITIPSGLKNEEIEVLKKKFPLMKARKPKAKSETPS